MSKNNSNSKTKKGVDYKKLAKLLPIATLILVIVALNVIIVCFEAPVAAIVLTIVASIITVVFFFWKTSVVSNTTHERRKLGLIAVIYLIAIIACLVYFPNAGNTRLSSNLQPKVTSLTSENADLQAKIKALTSENTGLQKNVNLLTSDNKALETKVESLNKQIIPEKYKCPNCGGDLRKTGCDHKKLKSASPVVAPKPEKAKATIKKSTPAPTATPKPTPTVKPVKKDKEIPTGKLSANKEQIIVGQTVKFSYVGKDNIGLVDPVKKDSQKKQLRDKLEGLDVNNVVVTSIGFDGLEWKKYTTDFSYKFTKAGTYKVYIKKGLLKDRAGNISKASNVVTITVSAEQIVVPTPSVTPTPTPTPTYYPGNTSYPTPVPTTTPATPTPTVTPSSTTSMPAVTLTTNDTDFKVGKTITVTATAWDTKQLKSFAITAANIRGTSDGMTIGNGTLTLTQTDKIAYTFPVTLTKVGAYYLTTDAGLAMNSDGKTSAASDKLQITVISDQVAAGNAQMNPVANDVERPVITVSSFNGFTGDIFDLTGTISDNSGSFIASSDSIQFNLPQGLTLVSKPVINGNQYTVKVKADTELSGTVTVKAGAVKDAAGNTSIESDPGTIIIKPVFMAPTKTADTTTSNDLKVASVSTTDTTTPLLVSSNDSSTTSTATVDSSSTSVSTTPHVEAPSSTTVAPDDIVWES
jgi:cell division protein FtsB